MAPETPLPASVYAELWRIVRMAQSRTVAILALDMLMRGFSDAVVILVMTVLAVLRPTVLDLEILPELLVALLIPPVSISPLMHTKILRHVKYPCRENENENSDNDEQGPVCVIFHSTLFSDAGVRMLHV